ncbi:MAG: hypothetical protein ACLUDH_01405 [Faecalispora sporosphaeroides]|jgi:hypothetical protein|uniref:hypothetical protein n=1 Tax=Faecalispora sporosphaeroides TaxID=1549 RepID=UPI002DD6AA58|nr:hypothetical protein [Faecalispora sporosphaeroides]
MTAIFIFFGFPGPAPFSGIDPFSSPKHCSHKDSSSFVVFPHFVQVIGTLLQFFLDYCNRIQIHYKPLICIKKPVSIGSFGYMWENADQRDFRASGEAIPVSQQTAAVETVGVSFTELNEIHPELPVLRRRSQKIPLCGRRLKGLCAFVCFIEQVLLPVAARDGARLFATRYTHKIFFFLRVFSARAAAGASGACRW